jgi:S1-C subfamily serine protease
MKRVRLLITLLAFSIGNSFSQNTLKSELIDYFDNSQNLNPIEGLWSLNVIRTQYHYDEIVGQDSEEIRSEWGIKRYDKLSFKVINIDEGGEDDGNWEAYFESSALQGLYAYKCDFFSPNWSVKTNAELTDGVIIEYDYFVAPEYLKHSKKKYQAGSRLHWSFVWTKKYPIQNQSINSDDWDGSGSGIIISESGHIVTNYHVIEDADEIEVEFMLNEEVRKYNSEIIQIDYVNDLAILKIVDDNFKSVEAIPYNFKLSSSDVGTKVYAYGYPLALSIMGKEIKITDGIISSKSGFDGDITTYQITAPIQFGNSGGPLFDESGNFIGINSSGLSTDVADNVGYTIKSSYVFNLLDMLPRSIDLPSNTKLKSLPLTEQIKEVSKYVVLVKVK